MPLSPNLISYSLERFHAYSTMKDVDIFAAIGSLVSPWSWQLSER